MFTFLSRARRVEVQREYRKRLLAVAAGLAFALAFLGAALSVPSYVILSVKAANAASAAPAASASASVDYEAAARDARQKAAALQKSLDEKPLLSVLERIAARAPQGGVALTGTSIRRQQGGAAVTISGTAAARESLVAFSKSLEAEPSFRNVALPVSALAKSRDITFSISLEALF